MRRTPRDLITVGLVLIPFGVLGAYMLAGVAWGGLLLTPAPERFVIFGLPLALSVLGIAMVSLGSYRACLGRRSSH
jgi:hypothetical protein